MKNLPTHIMASPHPNGSDFLYVTVGLSEQGTHQIFHAVSNIHLFCYKQVVIDSVDVNAKESYGHLPHKHRKSYMNNGSNSMFTGHNGQDPTTIALKKNHKQVLKTDKTQKTWMCHRQCDLFPRTSIFKMDNFS